jgi:hypothetical protein
LTATVRRNIDRHPGQRIGLGAELRPEMYIASVASNVVGLFLVVVALLVYFLIIRPSLKRDKK